jgi:hypothetical protein
VSLLRRQNVASKAAELLYEHLMHQHAAPAHSQRRRFSRFDDLLGHFCGRSSTASAPACCSTCAIFGCGSLYAISPFSLQRERPYHVFEYIYSYNSGKRQDR